jgi:hypothetical protein
MVEANSRQGIRVCWHLPQAMSGSHVPYPQGFVKRATSLREQEGVDPD